MRPYQRNVTKIVTRMTLTLKKGSLHSVRMKGFEPSLFWPPARRFTKLSYILKKWRRWESNPPQIGCKPFSPPWNMPPRKLDTTRQGSKHPFRRMFIRTCVSKSPRPDSNRYLSLEIGVLFVCFSCGG